MDIENIKIEDAADANYFIRKFFKDQLQGIKMTQLEQLVLAVYNMGKNGKPTDAESPDKGSVKPNPFKINDKVKAIEDIEMGQSGELIKKGTEGTVNSVNGDTVSFLFESTEDGEMFEVSVLSEKLEKRT